MEKLGHAAHQIPHIDRFGLQFLPPSEGQHALSQGRAPFRRAHRVVDEAADIGSFAHPPLREIQAADDHGEQIVEIMRDAAGELADGIHLLRLEERLLRGIQRLLRFAALGQIARHLGEADQPARRITHRIDQDRRPEARAVLAHAPALRLEPALALGPVERDGGQAGLAILLGIEARKMLPDDLALGIALETLRARIPAHHEARRIEHIDRVIRHALDEQAESFLAAPQGLVRLAPFAQVARHLGEADKGAVRIADGIDHDTRPEARAVLADAPALGLEPTFVQCSGERPGGHAGAAILLRIEAGEMLADDLLGPIPP